jgi:hypothetical protein
MQETKASQTGKTQYSQEKNLKKSDENVSQKEFENFVAQQSEMLQQKNQEIEEKQGALVSENYKKITAERENALKASTSELRDSYNRQINALKSDFDKQLIGAAVQDAKSFESINASLKEATQIFSTSLESSTKSINASLQAVDQNVASQNNEVAHLKARIASLEQRRPSIFTAVPSCKMVYTGAYNIIGCTAVCPAGTTVTGGGYNTGAVFSANGRYAVPNPNVNGYTCGVNIDGCSEGSLGDGCNVSFCYAICTGVN